MAIIDFQRRIGTGAGHYYAAVNGKKQVPFDPKVKPPLYYYLQEILLSEINNFGSIAARCDTYQWGETSPVPIASGTETSPTFTSDGMLAYARAYAKFKDQAYTQASNLTAIAERAKTFDMVLARLQQLHKGATALKRGRFKEFLNTFGVRPLKKHEHTRWTRPKQFGSLWLEYWMGWAPTVGDVYTTIETLSKPIPEETIRAGSSVPLNKSFTQGTGSNPYRAVATTIHSGKGTVWIQAKVVVTNPSLHIAQTLGLINPFKTIWETISFSWLADWFTNVGQILGQFTDWVGLQLKDLIISSKTDVTSSWSLTNPPVVYGGSSWKTMSYNRSHVWFTRWVNLTGLPTIKPIFRLPNGLSITRGATLASLLATMFAPSRR